MEKNERADETAKVVAKAAGTRRCLKYFTSLVHIRRMITERK